MRSSPVGRYTGLATAPVAARGAARPVVLKSMGGKAAELGAQLLLITTVPRILGPSDYGVFALALALVTVGSSSLAIGGPTLMSRFVPAAAEEDRAAVARALAMRVGRWRALEIAGLVVVATALAAALPSTFPADITALVTLALAIDTLATLAFQVALGLGLSTAWSFRFGVQNIAVVLGALVGHSIAGVEGAVAGIATASAISLAWGAAMVGRPLLAARPGAALPPGALRFGALHALGNICVQLLHRGAIVGVAILAGSSSQTGFAALAVGVSLAATYAVWQLFAVQLPDLVERTGGSNDVAAAEAEVRRLARGTVVLALVAALLGVVALDEAVPLVFGHDFDGARGAVAVGLALLPLAPLTGLITQVAALRLRADLRLLGAGAGAAVLVLACLVFIPAWEAQGATAAMLAGSAAMVLVSGIVFPRVFDRLLLAAGLGGSALVLGAALAMGVA
jgi:O-antigen/teichoic acid export membrane protein